MLAVSVLETADHDRFISQVTMQSTVDRLASSLIADVAGVVLEVC